MFAEVNGTTLFYEEEGAGPPCFVVTAVGHRAIQRCLSEQLRRRLRLVYVHLRGTGWSEDSEQRPASPALLAQDLDALREHLGLERVAVLGHSAPGLIALEYALLYPEQTSHVILVGTPPSMKDLAQTAQAHWEATASDERKALRDANFRQLGERMAGASPNEALRLRTLAAGPMYWFDPRFDASELLREQIGGAGVARLLSETLKDADLTADLRRIATPVFVALGRADFVVPSQTWDVHSERLIHGRVRVFERSGHYPMLEEQEAFDRALLDWLAATGTVGGPS